MKSLKKITALFFVAILGGAIIFSSCKKNEEDAPDIPPLSTFQMEYKLDPADTAGNKNIQSVCNFGKAGINVWAWNLVIGLNLAIPVAAFGESFNHTPTYANDVWTWEYSVNHGFTTYTAKLQGSIDGDYSHWEMYLSKSGAFTDALWYSGDSKLDGTEGSWSVNYYPNNVQTPLVDIVWHKDEDTGTSDIMYTNMIPGAAGNGDYVTYGITEDTDYETFYTIYDADLARTIEILFNQTTKVGKIRDSQTTNCWGTELTADEWQCWDETYQDVICLTN
jgi:hypothetical protein